MRPLGSTWLVVGVLLASAACGDAGFERPDRGDQVSSADSLYSPALFDSIAWTDDLTRARSGNEVYASRCRDCHGTLGEGNTPYARERGLDVPSLVAADWPLGDSLDAVRRRIFVGHEQGMPTWGVARISPRDVDAAAFYIVERLRPEMLGN